MVKLNKLSLIVSISFLIIVTPVICKNNKVKINFNETYIKQTTLDGIDLKQRDEVLTLILAGMKDEIIVYPSEGYYYFSFLNNGEDIKGNLRFDVTKRDEGEISFVYYKKVGTSKDVTFHHTLTTNNGVILKKIDTFTYELTFNNFKKIIHIYDANDELENKPKLSKYEEYIGPTFDDSGIRFHLIYDTKSQVFLFVLNETLGYSESFKSLDKNDYIRIGLRSQFVYYHDKKYNRMVLIGVSESNVNENNHYDGPFDQLPDSFVDGDHLKELIVKYDPRVKGQLVSYGIYKNDESSRYAIAPYIEYKKIEELFVVYQCINVKDKSLLNLCLGKSIY